MLASMSARKKLIVTGAHGFVAGSVLAQAGAEWEAHALSRGEPLAQRAGLRWHQLDPLEPGRLAQLFHEVRPAAVIHTAALSDIDYCQAHPELARAVNASLTRALAELCAAVGAKLVLCSTDTVFDGERAPYREADPPGPVNFYAQTKVEAEQIVSQLGAHGVIARLALVAGLPVLGAGNSFLARMLAAFKEGRVVGMLTHEVRTPIDVITLGRALLELAAGDHHGTFHLAGNSRLNRFEMAQQIAARFGFPLDLVVAQDPASLPGRAPRPRDVSLDNRKARAQLKTPMLSFADGLSLILSFAAPLSKT
jgi:dTDP-4-dehydrorhamnose reductase